MEKPLISIVVPVYNADKFLRKCIDSILSQTYEHIEVVCVDDNSTDTSLKILNDYAEVDNRVKVIHQENQGASIARNTALDNCSGQYIMFVDSDDWIEKETCEIALKYLMEYNADLVMWDYIREFENASLPKRIFNKTVVFEEDEVKNKLHRRMIGLVGEELNKPEEADALCTIWGKLYKTKLIQQDKIRFYDIRKIKTYEDGLFNLDVMKNVKKAVYVTDPLYHYRKTNAQSITSTVDTAFETKRKHLYQYMKSYIEDNNCSEDYKVALNNRIALEILAMGSIKMKNKKGRWTALNKLLNEEDYIKACKKLELKYFPIHWKIFYGCAKYRVTLGVFCLLWIIRRIKERRG